MIRSSQKWIDMRHFQYLIKLFSHQPSGLKLWREKGAQPPTSSLLSNKPSTPAQCLARGRHLISSWWMKGCANPFLPVYNFTFKEHENIRNGGKKGKRGTSGKKDGLVQATWCSENLQTLRFGRECDSCLSRVIMPLFSSCPHLKLYIPLHTTSNCTGRRSLANNYNYSQFCSCSNISKMLPTLLCLAFITT